VTDLSDFLLARIAEDEAEARREIEDGYGGDQHESGWPSNRVLAECDAKRQLVAEFERHRVEAHEGKDPEALGKAWGLLRAIAYEALPYRGHPEWHPSWRP
jgi:hypothetical protein